ncbi:MAG: trigger factor [Pseudohongiellaceae bacterium]|uniref:Trigger factor n=1 Tax=OM182 bacterium MED-G28 TaxID=1986256 RepID=A0A2A5WDF0_9GAMM|nr:MAG: trigger factor [OM182 bacterium MED-G28]|tara:strand:+ start:1581 stop:2942 length:1362 start_codon:yes stop_codon:yes gene_type:complete
MQVSVETTDGLERKMTIAVPSVQVDSAVNARLQEAAKSVRLNGFRKGKIPFKVIKSKFGKGVRQEVVGELMSQTYYDAINQESLKPAGQPKIEPTNIEEGKDLEFVATFEVYPEIILPDFSKLEVERLNADINDTDIDEMIETLRQQRQTWEVIEREAADQDMTNIDYLGKKDGEEFEGGAAQGANLVLGSERMIPGFEAGIIGKKAGDEFTLSLKFPTEYHNDDLAGAAVEFDITLNSVSEQVLPEVNEEFYKSFGVEEGDVEAFREEVSNNMRREMKTTSRNKLKTKVMDALIAAVDVTVPESLVSNEILQLKSQALQQMGGAQGADPSMLPDELFKEQADRRVILGLVLGEIIGQQNLQADPAKVRESVEELAATYESPDDVINWYYGNKEQLATIESAVVEDQVFDYIIEESVVTDTEVSYQEIIKPEPREGPSSEDDGLESENTESES